jgi:hypothetical protein
MYLIWPDGTNTARFRNGAKNAVWRPGYMKSDGLIAGRAGQRLENSAEKPDHEAWVQEHR